ncbi:murein transglycosylase domain-containing protein [Vibrio mediterranei]|uniref:murein transglycosylase domain-containing protein n=1 Tax=Vibrio mediterranei TaxID=689 RepID=UPI00406852FB
MSVTSGEYTVTSRFATEGLAPLPGTFTVTQREGVGNYDYQFVKETESIWGATTEPTKEVFVKYTNGFRNRTLIDFQQNRVIVSTVNSTAPKEHLVKAITTILLAPLSPEKVDIFSSKDIELGGEPFLYNLAFDNEGKPMRWKWRAERYARHLVATSMKTESVLFRKAHYVEFSIGGQSVISTGDYKYKDYVVAASKKYNVSEDLIYAIMKTESSFNPFAVSHVGAYGLMQVVPRTAGTDVYKLVYGKKGKPTRKELFDPQKNIDVGVAYLSLLQDRYLKGIKDPISKDYAVISAYNGGTGGVFRAFGTRKPAEAIERINSKGPNDVYHALRHDHPFVESRGYILKVTKARKEIKS